MVLDAGYYSLRLEKRYAARVKKRAWAPQAAIHTGRSDLLPAASKRAVTDQKARLNPMLMPKPANVLRRVLAKAKGSASAARVRQVNGKAFFFSSSMRRSVVEAPIRARCCR